MFTLKRMVNIDVLCCVVYVDDRCLCLYWRLMLMLMTDVCWWRLITMNYADVFCWWLKSMLILDDWCWCWTYTVGAYARWCWLMLGDWWLLIERLMLHACVMISFGAWCWLLCWCLSMLLMVGSDAWGWSLIWWLMIDLFRSMYDWVNDWGRRFILNFNVGFYDDDWCWWLMCAFLLWLLMGFLMIYVEDWWWLLRLVLDVWLGDDVCLWLLLMTDDWWLMTDDWLLIDRLRLCYMLKRVVNVWWLCATIDHWCLTLCVWCFYMDAWWFMHVLYANDCCWLLWLCLLLFMYHVLF